MADTTEQPAKKPYVPKVVLFTILILLLVPAVWFGVHTETFKLATTRQPDRYTELYFLNPTQLPTILQNGKTYKQSFAIVNHEAKAYTYTYQVALTGAGQSIKYPEASVTLQPGQRIERNFEVVSSVDSGDITVSVTLLEKQQAIRFHASAAKGAL
jgi:uncharacterized membrane protein